MDTADIGSKMQAFSIITFKIQVGLFEEPLFSKLTLVFSYYFLKELGILLKETKSM